MMSNTYKPIVGGLERSVETFAEEFRKRGHRVLVVAPEFKGFPCCREKGVFRVPAIRNFNQSGFSVELPISAGLARILKKFKPDIIHSQHPFLIGDTALRAAFELNKPLIFTYHTLYEKNRNYFFDSKYLTRFVSKLSIGYANLCDRIIAPSRGIFELLRKQGVTRQIDIIPTGIRTQDFKSADGKSFRKKFFIPRRAFVVGTVSRMASEKNIIFLAHAAEAFLKRNKEAYFLMVGEGPLEKRLRAIFGKSRVAERVVFSGTLTGKELSRAYAAMDVFAFASHSETQGLILAEAMAAGKPVVAVNAAAISEMVTDKYNGRIVARDNLSGFTRALSWVMRQGPQKQAAFSRDARKTAQNFSVSLSARKMLAVYREASKSKRLSLNVENSSWNKAMRLLKAQGSLMFNTAKSTVSAISRKEPA